jgi:tRNA-dihydrouridine synthase 3
MLSNEPPFVSLPRTHANENEVSKESSLDSSTRCPVFEATGSCRLGLKCRFLGSHVRKAEDGTIALVEDESKKALTLTANTEHNFISPATLKHLRTKKVEFIPQTYLEVCNKTTQYPTPVSDGYLQELKVATEEREGKENRLDFSAEGESATTITVNPDVEPEPSIEESNMSDSVRPHSVSAAPPGVATEPAPTKLSPDEAHAQADLPDVPFRFSEKRRLNWSNKTCMWSGSDTQARDNKYHLDLGPLTTVGNLVSVTR